MTRVVVAILVMAVTTTARAEEPRPLPGRAWDLEIVPPDRVSLPAVEAADLLSTYDRCELAIDAVRTATAASESWRSLAGRCAAVLSAAEERHRAGLEAAWRASERSWAESPILWMGVGIVLGAGAVGIGAWTVGR